MTLKEFREHTKDLPDSAVLWISDGGAWKTPTSILTRVESLLYCNGQNIPDEMKNRVEVRLELPQ
jgi:hypothetical protein